MEDGRGSGKHSTLSTIFFGGEGSKRRQAISEAQSSVNKVANSVLKIAEPEVEVVRDDSGCAWVQDGVAPKGRILGKQRSTRRILLESARSSLERAQMKIAVKGEDLKNKTSRGLSNATGSLARGMQKLMPKPMEEKEGESEIARNARLIANRPLEVAQQLANCTVSASEVARIRQLRCEQHLAGRYTGRQRRAPAGNANHLEQTAVPASQSSYAYEETTAERRPSTEVEPPQSLPAIEVASGFYETCIVLDDNRSITSSSSSLTFDLVSDEELLYAYQTALDELEEGDHDDSDETEIIALAVSRMHLHSDLVEFAVTRLLELLGLDPELRC
jgi:hypothetical protein